MKNRFSIIRCVYVATLIAVAGALCTSCNPDVELCSGDHPHRAQVVFRFVGNQYVSEDPGELNLFLERARHHMLINGDWATATGTFTPTIALDPVYSSEGDLYVPTGEWRTVALSSKYLDTDVDIAKALSLGEVLGDKWWSCQTMKYEELLKGEFSYWHDRNTYSDYIAALDDIPVLLANASFTVDEYASKSSVIEVPLSFTPVTQIVHINIPISTEDGIVVDALTAEVSGICGSMLLDSRQVDISKTYKVVFNTDIVQGTPTVARGTFYPIGIVSPQSSALITGPGILSVMVNIHFTDGGEVKTRTLEASLNMMSLIGNNPSVLADEKGRVFQTTDELTYDIPVMMHLSRTKVTSVGDAALEQWVDQTQIDVDF